MGLGAELKAKLGGKGAVVFDGDEAAAARGEDAGDGTVAGADFDDSSAEASPSASTMLWRAGSSVRKFWPSFGLRGMS